MTISKDDVITKSCPSCGKEQELLRGYIKYFKEYQDMQPKATLVCDCGASIDISDIETKGI